MVIKFDYSYHLFAESDSLRYILSVVTFYYGGW